MTSNTCKPAPSMTSNTSKPSPSLTTTIYKRVAIVLSLATTVLLTTYCGVINLFPVSDDQKLGAQFDAEIRADPKQFPIHTNPAVKSYVQGMVNRIIQAPEVKYDGTFPYRVEIIHDDNTINAFCTPGGYIYVYTGLLKAIDNEATLAGVIGHEIAHAEARHSTERMSTQLGAEMLIAIALGKANQNIQLAANMFAGLGLLKNSRSDETEADELSFKYLRSTSWYPGGIQFFFDKVKGRNSGGSIERLLSTHPLPQDRIDATQKRLKAANIPPPTEAQLNARGYTEFKRTIDGGVTGR
ncbi:MAG: M48 family metallopeptidase [bacterium]|nr:M48 family metallopeptidase [bacterium]